MTTQRLSGLDMLRGIAAVIVALNHALFLSGTPSVVSQSYLAVDFFFLLSGFVIAATFEARMPAMGVFGFLQARSMRLWPMIAVGVMLSGALFLASGSNPALTAAYVLLALLFLPGPGGAFVMNSPMWSIHFELLANAAHIFALRRLAVWGLALIATASLVIILLAQGWRDFDVGQGDRYLLGIPRIFLSYSLGILLWRINGTKARGPAWLAFLLLPLAILVASQLKWADHIVVLLVNPTILLCGLGFSEDSELRPLASFLGAWSFPLYALHWPVQKLALGNGHGWLTAFVWSIIAALTIGLILDRRMRAASWTPGKLWRTLRRSVPYPGPTRPPAT